MSTMLPSCVDPNMAFEMLKGTMTNVLPMILIGGWINWTFAGFITSGLSECLCCSRNETPFTNPVYQVIFLGIVTKKFDFYYQCLWLPYCIFPVVCTCLVASLAPPSVQVGWDCWKVS
jgi:hypothetical protein